MLDTNGCDFENDVSLFAEGDDPDGPALASGSEGFCKHVEAEVPADGTYYFRVSGVWPYVGSYPLVVGVE